MGRFNCFALRLATWGVALVLFPVSVTNWPLSFQVEVLERTLSPFSPGSAAESCALVQSDPAERATTFDLSGRVTARLVEAEQREPDAWLRDDYRIARVTLGYARRGSPIPHIEASYEVLGVHPDQVWPRIMARREAMLAEADFKKFFGGVSSPRKPVRSVRLVRSRQPDQVA